MKKTITGLFVLCVLTTVAHGQATDPGVNGQMKRMVYQQWDDWKPTPDLHWYGLPKNYYGWLYWRVLNNSYYNGEDRRPMRAAGPFPQNLASLGLQSSDDAAIRDTSNSMMVQSLATYASMSGGEADLPYALYFRDKFDGLLSEIYGQFDKVKALSPSLYAKIMAQPHAQAYTEYLDVTRSRIDALHGAFVDRGIRIEGYMGILKELQPMVLEIKGYLGAYVYLDALPTPADIQSAAVPTPPMTDAMIMKDILQKHKF